MVDNLEIIKSKVKELEREISNKDNRIVKKLQEINECFLQNYMLQIDDLKIYPVEIECYYYKKLVFEDSICHQNELQKNRFGKLYFHRKSKREDSKISTGYGGVDICLSLGDYYLSILIRSAYINNEKKIECGINKIVQRILCIEQFAKITNELEIKYNNIEKQKVLSKRNYKIYNSFVCHPRIKDKKYFYEYDKYKDNKYLLNSFAFDELRNLKNSFYTEKRKKEILKEYKI